MSRHFKSPIDHATALQTDTVQKTLFSNHPDRLSDIRRYLAISLPKLATDRIIRKRKGMAWRSHLQAKCDDAPIIIVDQIRNSWRITHLDEAAELAGLCHHQSLSDARAICPHVEVVYQDAEADQLLLEAIADWCDRYTPLVSLDNPDGIMLDITGCAHLFGGERLLADELLKRLFLQGFAASGAIASTPGAAWAASRFSGPLSVITTDHGRQKPEVRFDPVFIVEPGNEEEALAVLPLAGLRLDSETLGGLAKLGLRTIGQVMARPRAPLTRRFGKLLLLRMDQALGAVEEAITSRLPVPELIAERKLAEPIGRAEDIDILVERLAKCLCGDLEKRGAGARSIDLALFRTDGKVVRLGVGTSNPLRDPQSIARLFSERIAAIYDDFDTGLGFETGRLSVLQTEPGDFEQSSLLMDNDNHNEFSHLLDRLGARLGLSRIIRVMPGETHLPEKVENNICLTGDFENDIRKDFLQPVRPMRLLENPEPVEAIASVPEGPPVRFRWRKKLHVVVHVEGPERISDEWWNSHETGHQTLRHTRDYFRIEDDKGYRYWLYRQGLYVSETNLPRWYMHGIFS